MSTFRSLELWENQLRWREEDLVRREKQIQELARTWERRMLRAEDERRAKAMKQLQHASKRSLLNRLRGIA